MSTDLIGAALPSVADAPMQHEEANGHAGQGGGATVGHY